MLKILVTLLLAVLALIVIGAGIVYSGVINVGADAPHANAIHALLETARHRSIAVRAKDIEVPDLNDTKLIRSGAGNYDAMCAGCHLAPGVVSTELSENLNPPPPALTDANRKHEPAEDFWTIKHGIRSTAMPAWGKSMADSYIWGMVALLEQLPALTPMEYQALVAASDGHQHGGGESHVSSEQPTGADPQQSKGAPSTDVHHHADGANHHH